MTMTPIGGEPRLFALVPCAGTGSRSGSFVPKQYAPVAGQPMVAHTLQALARVARLSATLVVLAPDDDVFEDELPGFAGERGWVARCGGASRAETVAGGLQALRERGVQPHDWVLVHDAARCLLRGAWVDRLIDACGADEVGGLLAVPLADTLKSAEAGRCASTLDREQKWAAQTPQMFRWGLLDAALRHAASAGVAVTDEASAVEALGHRPLLVKASIENLKVTWPEDFALAERLLATARRAAEIRPVVWARDFEMAAAFYRDMGFQREFSRQGVAGFTLGTTAFLLQQAPAAGTLAEAAALPAPQLHLTLADLDGFWRRIDREGLAERYAALGVVAEPPVTRPWGLQEMSLRCPAGAHWRITQRLELPE